MRHFDWPITCKKNKTKQNKTKNKKNFGGSPKLKFPLENGSGSPLAQSIMGEKCGTMGHKGFTTIGSGEYSQ